MLYLAPIDPFTSFYPHSTFPFRSNLKFGDAAMVGGVIVKGRDHTSGRDENTFYACCASPL